MKTSFRWKNVLRGALLVAAVLGLYVPAVAVLEGTSQAAREAVPVVELPQGISVASTQASWHTVLASNH